MSGTDLGLSISSVVEELKTLHSELQATPGRVVIEDDFGVYDGVVTFSIFFSLLLFIIRSQLPVSVLTVHVVFHL